MEQLLLHFLGDFFLQTNHMAKRKTASSLVCLVHVLLYTAPFLLLTEAWWALAIIASTHFAIDRWRLVKFPMALVGIGRTGHLMRVLDALTGWRIFGGRVYVNNELVPSHHYKIQGRRVRWLVDHSPDPEAVVEAELEGDEEASPGVQFVLLLICDGVAHLFINFVVLLIAPKDGVWWDIKAWLETLGGV